MASRAPALWKSETEVRWTDRRARSPAHVSEASAHSGQDVSRHEVTTSPGPREATSCVLWSSEERGPSAPRSDFAAGSAGRARGASGARTRMPGFETSSSGDRGLSNCTCRPPERTDGFCNLGGKEQPKLQVARHPSSMSSFPPGHPSLGGYCFVRISTAWTKRFRTLSPAGLHSSYWNRPWPQTSTPSQYAQPLRLPGNKILTTTL